MEFGAVMEPSPGYTAPLAAEIEALGFDILLCPDTQNLSPDPIGQLSLASQTTTTLTLGTGVTNPITRDAAVMACALGMLDIESGGRAICGIGRGDSSAAHIGVRSSTTTELRRYIESFRAYVNGEEVERNGKRSKLRWLEGQAAVDYSGVVPGRHLASLQEGDPRFEAMLDTRIKAIVAFAPYAPAGYWSEEGIKNLIVPSLFIVGSQDQTTGFAAAQWLFDHAINAERYLLVYQGAIHEVATNPAPPLAALYPREYAHYQEPAWDNRRLNNINQHFITAFLEMHLLGNSNKYGDYLKLPIISNDTPRTDTKDPNYWKGFANWTAIGMELHQRKAQTDK